jgi:hypothetical protein
VKLGSAERVSSVCETLRRGEVLISTAKRGFSEQRKTFPLSILATDEIVVPFVFQERFAEALDAQEQRRKDEKQSN